MGAVRRIPTRVWYDSRDSALRVSVYNGLDDTYILPGVMYNVYPRYVLLHHAIAAVVQICGCMCCSLLKL